MRKFKHLTKTQRLQFEAFLKAKMPMKEIAKSLGVHISTLYREKKRGEYKKLNYRTWEYVTSYSSDMAEEKYRRNLKEKGAAVKLGNDYEYAAYIERRISEDKLSPGAVLGEIKRNNMKFDTSISINTLYKYIERGYFLKLDIKHLPLKERQKKRRRKVVIKRAPRGMSIEKRPAEIGKRNTFGHWEMDCVCGSTLSTLLVLTERLTRKEIILLMKNQKSKSVISALNTLEKKYGRNFKKIFRSITVDNGTEFSDYKGIMRSIFNKNSKRTDVYYCHPYTSCERGTNERINREIRRLIPKGSDLSKYSASEIQRVEDWVNNYPRQVLGYATSSELFEEELKKLAA